MIVLATGNKTCMQSNRKFSGFGRKRFFWSVFSNRVLRTFFPRIVQFVPRRVRILSMQWPLAQFNQKISVIVLSNLWEIIFLLACRVLQCCCIRQQRAGRVHTVVCDLVVVQMSICFRFNLLFSEGQCVVASLFDIHVDRYGHLPFRSSAWEVSLCIPLYWWFY